MTAITIERTHAGLNISTIIGSRLVRMRYIGYTEEEALRLFLEETQVKA